MGGALLLRVPKASMEGTADVSQPVGFAEDDSESSLWSIHNSSVSFHGTETNTVELHGRRLDVTTDENEVVILVEDITEPGPRIPVDPAWYLEQLALEYANAVNENSN